MTFKPTKCNVPPRCARPPYHIGTGQIGVFMPSDDKKPNALLVPLVPGMEAVVRAHLAAKPKPAKKRVKHGK